MPVVVARLLHCALFGHVPSVMTSVVHKDGHLVPPLSESKNDVIRQVAHRTRRQLKKA